MVKRSLPVSSPDAAILPAPRGKPRGVLLVCLLLSALVWAVFGQTRTYDYVNYDDNSYVYENVAVAKGLSFKGVGTAFIEKDLGLWNPMIRISHMVDVQLFGKNAAGGHLTNVLLHLASVLLLFLVLRQLTGVIWPCAFVAALFAIHPLRVESVAWISERKDVLSGFFFMLTLGAYVHYLKKQKSISRYGILVFVFALGLISKPMLVTAPCVLLLIDYWPLNRLLNPSSSKAFSVNWPVIIEKIPLLILSFALSIWLVLTPEDSGGITQIPFWTRMAEAPVAFVTYLVQMVWPSGLAVIYPHTDEAPLWWPASLLFILALSLAFFWLRKKYPHLLMGWLWNMGMLVPVCGIIQISRHWQADHYTYLAQIGIYILVAWGIQDLTVSWKHRPWILGIAATLALLALSAAAYRQTSYWKNSETLWRYTLTCTEENGVAHSNLGTALFDQDRLEEARSEFIEALRIDPRDTNSFGNLGLVYLRTGEPEKAMECFNKILQINPRDVKSFNNFAWILATNPNPAGRDGKKALEFALLACSHPKGNNPWFLDTLAAAYAETGDYPQAIKWTKAALELDFENPGLKDQIQKHLESYQHQKPWRETDPKSAIDKKNREAKLSGSKPS